ncbi:MAG: hypothetical protein JO002_06915 [Burkholderiaceae bacterium]|nr:hypothetical protein [Burkholderiaceae bacterium]
MPIARNLQGQFTIGDYDAQPASQPAAPSATAVTKTGPLSTAQSNAQTSLPAAHSGARTTQIPQLSPPREKIASISFRDDQSRGALLQTAEDATRSFAQVLDQMKDLVGEIDNASLDADRRVLAQRRFNDLANRLNAKTAPVRQAAIGGDASRLGIAMGAMARVMSAVTASSSALPVSASNDRGKPVQGSGAADVGALSEALNAVAAVRTMILTAAHKRDQAAFGSSDVRGDAGVGGSPNSGEVSQDVNRNGGQALQEAQDGIFKDWSTIFPLVACWLQDCAD